VLRGWLLREERHRAQGQRERKKVADSSHSLPYPLGAGGGPRGDRD
jgi:hypothetical protein